MARRRQSFTRPAPRTKMWIGAGVGVTNIAGSTKALVSLLSAGAKTLRPFTILRTRMLIHAFSDQLGASEEPICSYGSIVVTDTAAAIGVTAVPNPSGISGDPEADWYLWQAMSVVFDFASAVGFDANAGAQYVIDSKAMRKVGPDDDVVDMATTETGHGVTLHTNGRMLIQLH